MSNKLAMNELSHTDGLSDMPAHTKGTQKGEQWVISAGREPGRQTIPPHRTARDATSIDPSSRQPILPEMPNLPPA